MINLKIRSADEVIGDNYMRRWHLRRKPGRHNLYLHRYDGSDDDRALHDHPWKSIGIVLWGNLFEVNENGERRLWPLIPKFRSAQYAHRLRLEGGPAFTLFFTFPKEREWGFYSARGWIHWRQFTAQSKTLVDTQCAEEHKAV